MTQTSKANQNNKINVDKPSNLGYFKLDLDKEIIEFDHASSSILNIEPNHPYFLESLNVEAPLFDWSPLTQAIDDYQHALTPFFCILNSKEMSLYLSAQPQNEKLNTKLLSGYMHVVDQTIFQDIEHIEKASILSNMTHEIRTPLNAIKGYAELLSETQLNPEQLTYLDHIRKTSKHLSKIVNDILDYSKLEAGKMQIDNRPFDLDKLLDDVHIMLKEQTKAKQLYLDMMNIDCPKRVIGDAYRIRQILVNFVSNAAKFTEIGGISLTCQVDHAIDSTHLMVHFKVKDTGIGISSEELPRVFQAFDQANASTSRLYGGTGLGLHISMKIAHLMGGEIRLESQVNQGSTFTLSIPLLYEPLSDDQNQALKRKPRSGSLILLVEDNPLNQKLSERILTNLGMNVHIAQHGLEAISMVKNNAYDLLFMDIHMPVMDGFEATRIIRKQKEVPIIAMSSDALYDDLQSILLVGMSDVIEKPVDPMSMLAILSKWIPE